jgi:predicted transcriptional regulator of viral defense system
MTTLTSIEDRIHETGNGTFFRTRDLDELGISYYQLQQLVARGSVERVARGLYRLTSADTTEYHSLAAACARIPGGIVCLLSALGYHDIGSQVPRRIWIAIPHKAREPRIPEFPIRIVRFSGASLQYGIERISIEGVPVRITNPARTVVDCFRFRRIVGRDVALEALRESLRERKVTTSELWRVAEVCRAKSLIGPYIESLQA